MSTDSTKQRCNPAQRRAVVMVILLEKHKDEQVETVGVA